MQAGCEVVFAADAAKHLVGLMKSNIPGVDAACKITFPCDDVTARIPKDTSIIFASPPCQALSAARAGTTEEQRAGGLALVQWTLDVCSWTLETLPAQKGRKPFAFCCENVVSSKLAELLADVKRRHYYAFDYAVLQLRDFGTPTDRKRMIFGSKRGQSAASKDKQEQLSISRSRATCDQTTWCRARGVLTQNLHPSSMGVCGMQYAIFLTGAPLYARPPELPSIRTQDVWPSWGVVGLPRTSHDCCARQP